MNENKAELDRTLVTPVISGQSHPFYETSIRTSNEEIPSTFQETNQLIEAIKVGDLDLLQQCISNSDNRDLIHAADSEGNLPLHYAAELGRLDALKYFIEELGILVDSQDTSKKQTALMKSMSRGFLDCSSYLYHRGASICLKDLNGNTALHCALSNRQVELFEAFSNNYGQAELSCLNLLNNSGDSLLHLAANNESIACVQKLLDFKANPFIRNQNDETAYDIAANSSTSYICFLLYQAERRLSHVTGIKSVLRLIDMDVLFQNQRAYSVLSSFIPVIPSTNDYNESNLTSSDICTSWCKPNGTPCTKEKYSIHSRQAREWYFLSDWQVDLKWPSVDSEGWQYGKSFSDNSWFPCPAQGLMVRRRRWVRSRKVIQGYQSNIYSSFTLANNDDSRYFTDAISHLCSIDPIDLISSDTTKLKEILNKYEDAIQLILSKMKDDLNESRKINASFAVRHWLDIANDLQHKIDQQIQQSPSSSSENNQCAAFWEKDEKVTRCPSCDSAFNVWIRRHHCRGCGKIFCDSCSKYRVPQTPEMLEHPLSKLILESRTGETKMVRVCESCFNNRTGSARTMPRKLLKPKINSRESNENEDRSKNQSRRGSPVSTASRELIECPVCRLRLSTLKESEIENHVNDCLMKGIDAASIAGGTYVSYTLNTSLEVECLICFEEFSKGQRVARLTCFCCFHQDCIDDWFARGKLCPVHYK